MAKKQSKQTAQENFLDFVPVFSKLNSWEANENDIVTIHMVHRGPMAWVAQKMMGAPKEARIKLDELGSFVVRHIDGQRTIKEVADLVGAEFGEKAEPLYERLAEYMQTLHNNGFIYYKDKEPEPKA